MYRTNSKTLRDLFKGHLQEVQEHPIDERLPIYSDALEDTISTFFSEHTTEDIAKNFIMGSKVFSKLKRTDPSKKIIDAYDIDWTGYTVNIFNRNNEDTGEDFLFRPKNTYELLDILFRMLQFLYEKYKIFGLEDVMWNDTGLQRSYKHRLFWVETSYMVKINTEEEEVTLWDAIIIFRTEIQTLIQQGKVLEDEDCQEWVKKMETLIDEYTGDMYWNPYYFPYPSDIPTLSPSASPTVSPTVTPSGGSSTPKPSITPTVSTTYL